MKCLLCNSKTSIKYVKNNFYILRCHSCRFEEVLNITEKEIKDYYDKDYFNGNKAKSDMERNIIYT